MLVWKTCRPGAWACAQPPALKYWLMQIQYIDTHQPKKLLTHDHIEHCLDRSVAASPPSAQKLLGEFKAITKYL